MLNITKDTILKIRTKSLRNVPRDIYLVGSMEMVKEVFQNAYIIPFVRWYEFSSMFQVLLPDVIPNKVLSYLEAYSLKEEIAVKKEELREQLASAYTVIPFTPSKKMYASVTDWKLEDSNLMEKTRSELDRFYSSNTSTAFLRLLLENSNAMSVLLRGVLYDTPCKFCASIYNRVSGDCEIFNTDKYEKQTCQPRLTFAAQLFEGDNFDLTEELDSSKDLILGILNDPPGKMEV
jgi:hypothetical protein